MRGGWFGRLFGPKRFSDQQPNRQASGQSLSDGQAACTIVAKKQIAHARVLAESFRKHHPRSPFFVLLADRVGEYFDPAVEPFQCVSLEELNLPAGRKFLFQHTADELRKALKPFFFAYLFEKRNVTRLLYFDPAIWIANPLEPVFDLLDRHSCTLVPFLTAPIPEDNHNPTEATLMRWGTYDPGFMGLSRCDEVQGFLTLWQKRQLTKRRVANAEEALLEEHWLDLVPGFCPRVHVLRDDGYDLAHWNLHTRPIKVRSGVVTVHGGPAYFFHFHGFDPEKPQTISRFQDRLTFESLGEGAAIFRQYRDLLFDRGYREVQTWPYAFDEFDNGAAIPAAARRLLARLPQKIAEQFADPFAAHGSNTFFNWLNQNVDGPLEGRPLITRLWNEIYQGRNDLHKVFPNPFDADRHRFRTWLFEYGGSEEKLDERLLPGRTQPAADEKWHHESTHLDPFGINIAGYFASEKGVGEGVRSEIRALTAAGVPFVLNNFTDPGSQNRDVAFPHFSAGNPYAVNLIHVNADAIPEFVYQRGQSYLHGHYNVGYWAWELANFPTRWNNSFRYLQEIWVPSSFTQESVSRNAPLPVVRIPHTLTLNPPLLKLSRRDYGLPEERFLFLFVFDFSSYFERKNPLAVIRAFKKAFGPHDPATLVLKCSRPEFHPQGFQAMQAEAADADVHILRQVLSREETDTLISLADCYVSLHRSEGFGLTMAEAMALGKPVIATSYSGNLDFMNPSNSFLVKYRMTQLEADYGPYQKGSHWADADVDHAAELMRLVYEKRELANEVAQRGKEDVHQQLAPATVGKMVRDRLQTLLEEGRLPACDSRRNPPPTAAPETSFEQVNDPSSGLPLCSIIIPVHNRAALTQQCLDAVLHGDYDTVSIEVLVVDDASTDETDTLLAQYNDRIRTIRHDTNTGFALACNDGAAQAKGEYLLFLNNDTIAHPGWLDALYRYALEHPRAGAVGSKLLFLDDSIQHAGMVICQDRLPRHIYTGFPADHPAVNKSRKFPAVTGACLLIRRDLFVGTGGFDTCYLNSHEDVDLCLRLGEMGYEIHYCHESVLHHLESATRPSGSAQEERNTQLFLQRWEKRITPCDLNYYAEDGLLGIEYTPLHPLNFRLAPQVGVLRPEERGSELDHLLQARTGQVLQLLKDNTRLQVQIEESAFHVALARAGLSHAPGVNGEATAEVSHLPNTPTSPRFDEPYHSTNGTELHANAAEVSVPMDKLQYFGDQLLGRDEELWRQWQGLLEELLPSLQPPPANTNRVYAQTEILCERLTNQRIRTIVQKLLPCPTRVIVVCEGVEALMNLDERETWPFPQDASGAYCKDHPASSEEAIQRLEALHERGAEYLLIPAAAFWWLDHYNDLRVHLDANYQLCWQDENCRIYELTPPIQQEAASLNKLLDYRLSINQIRSIVSRLLPAEARLLVVSKGDEELLKLEGRKAWHFPQDERGAYAGYHPASSEEAIAMLEQAHDKGVDYLLFPSTSFWWLDHYAGLRTHLDTNYQLYWNDENCIIYELAKPKPNGRTQVGSLGEQVSVLQQGLDEKIATVAERVTRLQQILDEKIGFVTERVAQLNQLLDQKAGTESERVTKLNQLLDERVGNISERVTKLHQLLDERGGLLGERLAKLNQLLDERVGEASKTLVSLEQRLVDLGHQVAAHAAEARHGHDLAKDLERRIGAEENRGKETAQTLTNLSGRLTPRSRPILQSYGGADPNRALGFVADAAALGSSSMELPPIADLLYGTEAAVKERQRTYLPFFQNRHRVAVLACGRGEFLQLLNSEGRRAVGVEVDAGLAKQLQAKGLDVLVDDPIQYLNNQAPESLDGLFTPRLFEYLSPEQLAHFLATARSRLRSGGVLVAEMINPEVFESWKSFYLEGSAKQGVLPHLLLYLCQQASFASAKIYYPQAGGFSQQGYYTAPEYALVTIA